MPGNFASVKVVVNLLLIVKLGCKHWIKPFLTLASGGTLEKLPDGALLWFGGG